MLQSLRQWSRRNMIQSLKKESTFIKLKNELKLKKSLLFLSLFLIISVTLTAQTLIQKDFHDTCNQAITYFKAFLIKQGKDRKSFEMSKELFAKSLDQLAVLKTMGQIDSSNFNYLNQELISIKGLEYTKIITQMNHEKERHNIRIDDTIVSLSLEGTRLAVFIGFVKHDLETFFDSLNK